MAKQRVIFTVVGTDRLDTMLLGGQQIRGVQVDNPSGSWLYLPEIQEYVPPYVLGWARNIRNAVLKLSFKFVDGPSGQLSTRAGGLPLADIYDTNIPDSEGVPFQSRQDQPEINSTQNSVDMSAATGNVTTNLLGGSLTSRLRVFGMWVRNASIDVAAQRLNEYVDIYFHENPFVPAKMLGLFELSPNKQADGHYIAQGAIDLALGNEIRIQWVGVADVDRNNMAYHIVYAVI